MTTDWWTSFGVGGGLALVYGLLSFLSLRRALRQDARRFYAIFFVGMVTRMLLMLAVLLAVLLLAPVNTGVVALTFVLLLIVGLAIEVFFLYSRAPGGPLRP